MKQKICNIHLIIKSDEIRWLKNVVMIPKHFPHISNPSVMLILKKSLFKVFQIITKIRQKKILHMVSYSISFWGLAFRTKYYSFSQFELKYGISYFSSQSIQYLSIKINLTPLKMKILDKDIRKIGYRINQCLILQTHLKIHMLRSQIMSIATYLNQAIFNSFQTK